MITTAFERARRDLMVWLDGTESMTAALEEWVAARPGSVAYDRLWASNAHVLSGMETYELGADPRVLAYKRLGFLRRGSGGEPLAFVEAVVLRQHLPPWAQFELDHSRMPIGEMIIGRMKGVRHTLEVSPVAEFDSSGEPICVRVRARLDAVPFGGVRECPLALVTEKIYERTLGMI